MFQKALMVIGLIAVMVVGGLVLFANIELVSEETPLVLQEWTGSSAAHQGELQQWQVIWNESKNKIKRVEVITNEPDSLRVKVHYRYSGDQGETVFACGNIGLRSEHQKWTCRPEPLIVGDGAVILQFQTGHQATDYECSGQLVVNLFRGGERQDGETPFYNNYFAYQKAWVKGAEGTLGRLKQRFHGCSKSREAS